MDDFNFRFVVLSDIHATDVDSNGEDLISYVSTKNTEDSNNPFLALKRTIEDEKPIDAIMCAGDISYQANKSGLNYAWKYQNELKESTTLNRLYAVNGNHDIDSRYIESAYDPREMVQSLEPKLPIGCKEGYLNYWAENFHVHYCTEKRVRVVMLNTAAFHGGGKDYSSEMERGRVTTVTLERLRKALVDFSPEPKINILLCHHHPRRNNTIDNKDYSEMIGGDSLLELLNSEDVGGGWLVVHGHKHHPKIDMLDDVAVLSAASFSFQGHSNISNQFHLVEMCLNDAESLDIEIAGTVKSWTWDSAGRVWRKAILGTTELSHSCGFGLHENTKKLVSKVHEYLSSNPREYVLWDRVVDEIPGLKYINDQQYLKLKDKLKKNHNIIILDMDKRPHQVGYSCEE